MYREATNEDVDVILLANDENIQAAHISFFAPIKLNPSNQIL